jgi:hypothetical protein
MSINWRQIRGSAKKLCGLFGLPKDFFDELLENDDWTFVIRIHALLEPAVTWALDDHFRAHQISDFIGDLSLSGRTSKLTLIESFDILGSDATTFIKAVSTIRNRVVHNIRHIRFDLPRYIADLAPDKKRDFLVKIGTIHEDSSMSPKERESLRQDLAASPKQFILKGTLLILALIFETVELAHLRREVEEATQKHLRNQARLAALLRNKISHPSSQPALRQ